MALAIEWVKCDGGQQFCRLADLDLGQVSEQGIYVIWHEGNPGRVVYVGQGDVGRRLEVHRENPSITQYASYGALCVTWASVASQYCDGVERYLADRYQPLAGEAYPDAQPVAVNGPWG